MIKPNKTLLRLLADGQFHSGEQLGKTLNITRSAVWKHIRQLTELGLTIEKVTNKGYRLTGGIELLEKNNITSRLSAPTQQLLSQIELLDSIDSTNRYLLDKARDGTASNGHIVMADQQTAGRGRRGRQWFSPYGYNIYLSALWEFHCDPAEISSLSPTIAVVVSKVLEQYGIKNGLQLKWPNDIYYQHKKLAGILSEMLVRANEVSQVVIGIGINLQNPSQAYTKIDQAWTDIAAITSSRPQRNYLAGLLLNDLLFALSQFEQEGFQPYFRYWQEHDYLKNQPVIIEQAQQKMTGIAQGINLRGELLITDQNNLLHKFLHGEVIARLLK